MSEHDLTAFRLRNLLAYSPDTGIFTWLVARGGVSIGSLAGCVRPDGYVRIKVDGHLYLSHRLAWLYVHGSWPKGHIDHINGVRTDNRISNLRDVTRSEQMQNTKLQSSNTSGVCGVSWYKREGKWRARIKADGRNIYLGCFEDFDKALAARQAAERKYNFHPNHGLTEEDRANTNPQSNK